MQYHNFRNLRVHIHELHNQVLVQENWRRNVKDIKIRDEANTAAFSPTTDYSSLVIILWHYRGYKTRSTNSNKIKSSFGCNQFQPTGQNRGTKKHSIVIELCRLTTDNLSILPKMKYFNCRDLCPSYPWVPQWSANSRKLKNWCK